MHIYLYIAGIWRHWNKIITRNLITFESDINNIGPVEKHDFYHCISGLFCLQKPGGGRIQRSKLDETGKLNDYIMKIYCFFCNIGTCEALLRTFLFLGGVLFRRNRKSICIFIVCTLHDLCSSLVEFGLIVSRNTTPLGFLVMYNPSEL